MWIKKLYATFGKLDNRTLELSDGLNIVNGENEAGKSTWSAFIRAMLYGISTREKARAGHLPDKEKYRPWNGSPMYGRMELCRGGDEIEIERTSSRGGVFSKENARNITTGETVQTGEALVGAARGVYERSAFIGQLKLNVDRDADTEKRILALASGGDEEISATEVKARLEKKQREIRSVRGLGALPETEAEKEKVVRELSRIAETEAEILLTEESLESWQKDVVKVLRSISIAECEERQKREEHISRARADLQNAEKAVKELAGYPARDVLNKLSDVRDEWQTLSLSCERLENEFSVANLESQRVSEKIQGSPFWNVSEDAARQQATEDKKILSERAKKSPFAIVLVLLGIALVPFVKIIPVAVIIVGALWFILSGGKDKKSRTVYLAEKYGKAEEGQIDTALQEYLQLLSQAEQLSNRKESVKLSYEKEKTARDMRLNDIVKIFKEYGVEAEDVSEGERALRDKANKLEASEREYENAKIRVEAFSSTADEPIEKIQYTDEEIPTETTDELKARENALKAQIKGCELNLAALRERISGLDKQSLEKRLLQLSKREEELLRQYDAYDLAIKTMAEADAELKGRFSPEIEARASEIFHTLTGGSFEVVRIRNNDFEMEVARGQASEPHDELTLSQGTLDELYFSLRLALCEMILSGDDAPPMVLDDALVNFDDVRMKRALELLKELSKTRQIILFSCHKREAEYFAHDTSVNKVNI